MSANHQFESEESSHHPGSVTSLPGDNPDVGSLLMTHENGAISSLNTCYASASEYYVMNIYGKKMSAYYNLFDGLRAPNQGHNEQYQISVDKVDTLAKQLIEWADAAEGGANPELGGDIATESLAVIKAGIKSVTEGRHIDLAEVLAGKSWELGRKSESQ